MAPSISIMITTKNRAGELRRTCAALRRLSPAPLEILITADGCTDDTVAFVRAEMPQARLFVHPVGRGSIVSRDRMVREAHGDFVLSLDDDSYPQETDALARIGAILEKRPRVAVLHFPQRSDEYPETLGDFDFGPEQLTRTFSSAGAVLRRSVYLQLPGFEPFFFHAYEEPDYALQCVAAGHEILYSPEVTIRHHYSPAVRSEIRTHHRHARNEFASTLLRCPLPHLPLLAGYRVASQFRYACKRGPSWIVREPMWWGQALALIGPSLRRRRPLRWSDYRRWLALPDVAFPPKKSGAVLLAAKTGEAA